ncbi:transcriptional regulator [Amaricoccus solimangrovi]
MTLASFLENHRLTQASFAKEVGVAQSTISRLCAGKVGISLQQALRIEQATNGEVPVASWHRAECNPVVSGGAE